MRSAVNILEKYLLIFAVNRRRSKRVRPGVEPKELNDKEIFLVSMHIVAAEKGSDFS